MSENILVLCVDRDADILKKTGREGPVVGRRENLDTAVALGLADPTETDTNSIFEAIRLYDNYKSLNRDVEVVTVVGSERGEVASDEKLAEQIDGVVSRFEPDAVVVVTDGADDEYVLPLIQSRAKVISLSRVITKQSEKLESTYYVILDFMREVVTDQRLARLVLGVPAIALIIYAILGSSGWRIILGVAGFYMLVKGFQLEEHFEKAYDDFKNSIIAGRMSIFTYIVAIILGAVGVVMGRGEAMKQAPMESTLDYLPYFLTGSIDFFMFAAIVAILGKSIDALVEGFPVYKYGVLIVFVVALRLIFSSVALFLENKLAMDIFALTISLGLFLSIVAFIGIRSAQKKKAEVG